MQLDHLKVEKPELRRKRSSHLSPEETPAPNRSMSRSSSTGTIQDEIQDTLHSLLRKQKELEHDQKVTEDWRAMATKIDKILFYVFLILTVVSTLGLLVVAPLFRTNVQRKIKLWNGTRRPWKDRKQRHVLLTFRHLGSEDCSNIVAHAQRTGIDSDTSDIPQCSLQEYTAKHGRTQDKSSVPDRIR